MEIEAVAKGRVVRVRVDKPRPLVEIPFEGTPAEPPPGIRISRGPPPFLEAGEAGVVVSRGLSLEEHVYGLGERAYDLDRKRRLYRMWNTDVGCASAYRWYVDPMYVSIPFFIVFDKEKAEGYFFNTGSEVLVDVGFRRYDEVTVFVPEESVEFFIIRGRGLEEVLEAYAELVGRPHLLPEWALGYQISRFSYYPQERVIEVVKKCAESGIGVTAVYLDIDYMEGYKAFTWDAEKFPDPRRLVDELHKLGVRAVTIVDPFIKVDQRYDVFREALGLYVETEKGEIYIGRGWPGASAWADFLNPRAREWWAEAIRRWVNKYGVDGIWLDMNEPTDLAARDCSMDKGAVHDAGGAKVPHARAHNLYADYQAEATYEGLRRAGREPYILSRAGSFRIQRYAAVWTGDNIPSWDDLRLQTAVVLGLSMSGVPYVGIDIGGFAGAAGSFKEGAHGVNDLDLLVRYYQTALFFPIFRTHRAPDSMDKEACLLPRPWRDAVKRVIDARYRFLPYLSALALEAHERGRPMLRPLAYYHQDDPDTHAIYDEYYVGPYVLYAPLLSREGSRQVYLPRGRWADFWRGRIYEGLAFIKSEDEMPIYIREGSVVPLAGDGGGLDFFVFGEGGSIKLRSGVFAEVSGGVLRLSSPIRIGKVISPTGVGLAEVEVGGVVAEVRLR